MPRNVTRNHGRYGSTAELCRSGARFDARGNSATVAAGAAADATYAITDASGEWVACKGLS
jgi:hypothetical protein